MSHLRGRDSPMRGWVWTRVWHEWRGPLDWRVLNQDHGSESAWRYLRTQITVSYTGGRGDLPVQIHESIRRSLIWHPHWAWLSTLEYFFFVTEQDSRSLQLLYLQVFLLSSMNLCLRKLIHGLGLMNTPARYQVCEFRYHLLFLQTFSPLLCPIPL